MSESVYVIPENRGFIAVSGPDARTFLQGIVTNDVGAVGPATAQYGAMLTPQGRVMWDFVLAEIDSRLVLQCEADRLPAFLKRLSMYRFRAEATVEDGSAEFAAVVFPGAAALAALDLGDNAGAARPWHGGSLFADPRLPALGARAIVAKSALDAALAETGFDAGERDAYDQLRLSLGVPSGAVDLPPEKALPLEVGFDELHGVSWTKGCYMGQELTARMNYRALVKKRLLPVAIDGPAPEPGSPVELDGKAVGEMRSSNGALGLAYLRLEAATAGTPLSCGGAALRPQFPPWLKLPAE